MNIADIAKMAGVSNAAVSRYFNNGYISEAKKEAIRKVVEETGYRPSAQAQTLRTKKTKMIGVIIPKIASSAVGSVVEGIMDVLNDNGYQMLLADTDNNATKELEYLKVFTDKQVDGVILVATIITEEHRNALNQMKVPVVIVGQRVSGHYCVYHDEYHCMYDVTRLFLDKGCKELGYISAPLEDKATGLYRYTGFCDAVEELGAGRVKAHMEVSYFNYESGYASAAKLIEQYPKIDGIICATDMMCIGAMACLRDHGYRIPQDVLLSGHGNGIYTNVTAPPITTVQYSFAESGKRGAEILLELLQGKESAVKGMMLGYTIREKESTQRK